MIKNTVNTELRICGGGVEPSSRASFRNCKKGLKKFLAFTLAETLIVMGIIGIVSALTLPNLNSSTGEKEKVAKVKKLYQNLDDAMGRAVAVYGNYSEWDNSTTASRLADFLKISKDCGHSRSSCFSSTMKEAGSGSEVLGGSNSSTANYMVLADGTSLAISGNTIYVDIDGPQKGSATASKDVFAFEISDTGEIKPSGDLNFNAGSLLSCGCFSNGGVECTMWVIQNENLDYLKCPDKLTENKTSCK